MVTVGLALGFDIFVADKPVLGDHEYVIPLAPVIPIVAPPILFIQEIVGSGPAAAIGAVVLTLTSTEAVALQPLAVFVVVKI